MFLQDQISGLASYFGQSVEVIAFIFGIMIVIVFLGLVMYIAVTLGRQTLSAPMDMLIFGIGIAIVTFLGWWSPWILITTVFIGVFAFTFFKPGAF